MTAKQKLHQANLVKWTSLFQEQSSSGLTVKDWCSQNNISIHSYNYWKHAAKEAYVDSILPEIVPIPAPASLSGMSPYPSETTSFELRGSYNSRESLDAKSVSVSVGDICIEIGPSASDEIITSIIKAVRHA